MKSKHKFLLELCNTKC